MVHIRLPVIFYYLVLVNIVTVEIYYYVGFIYLNCASATHGVYPRFW